MKKMLLLAMIGFAGLMSAQKIKSNGCSSRGCNYTYASTCSTFTNFTVSQPLTIEAALAIANEFNQEDCGKPVKEVTIVSRDE
ncbi:MULTISPECIES: hypothetical protein [Chryseobacterium]|uniref:Uncharacterized protein n=1 Tax=Chryseobacterium taihuense TaxID=1141221 RepID=A0A4U8WFN2_9FLAO|nr:MULTISPECIES: hypothetical protein [Chryseobacterium]QQV02934.1 hypothetical protein I6I61_00815 [Chryseobacterium sp. FDAARGOS 1104]VFB03785.1 Uncharacterised protein [Chryseobacterium taihuense]